MLSFETSELRSLAARLDGASRKIGPGLVPVVKKAAQKVKDGAAERAGGIGHAPHYPRSISYDFIQWGRGARAEIGPDKGRTQGALGNILEYGTSKNAPIPHLGPALDAEEGPFLEALAKAEADALRLT